MHEKIKKIIGVLEKIKQDLSYFKSGYIKFHFKKCLYGMFIIKNEHEKRKKMSGGIDDAEGSIISFDLGEIIKIHRLMNGFVVDLKENEIRITEAMIENLMNIEIQKITVVADGSSGYLRVSSKRTKNAKRSKRNSTR